MQCSALRGVPACAQPSRIASVQHAGLCTALPPPLFRQSRRARSQWTRAAPARSATLQCVAGAEHISHAASTLPLVQVFCLCSQAAWGLRCRRTRCCTSFKLSCMRKPIRFGVLCIAGVHLHAAEGTTDAGKAPAASALAAPVPAVGCA